MSPRARALLTWLALMAAGAAVLATRLEFSYDLALFLPEARSPEQQVLLERVGDAPGARLMLIVMPADTPPESLSSLAEDLRDQPLFSQVLDAEAALSQADLPDPLWGYRYLLTDTDFSVQGLKAALGDRRRDLLLLGGPAFNQLVAADPYLASVDLLTSLAPTSTGTWETDAGQPVLLAETRAPAFDLAAQQVAVDSVRQTLAAYGISAAEVTGVGVFGVDVRDTIHNEARFRTLAASAALALVLLLAYRRLSPLWLAAIPLSTGALLGLSAVALVFGQAHGITLAFGFTLLGIAIDYPLHLLSASRIQQPAAAARTIWPTLRLGAASTMLAYLALALGGSEGLAQLGVFSLVGVAAAALTTRWILPWLTPATAYPAETAGQTGHPGTRLSAAGALAAGAALLILLTWQGQLWDNQLTTLSPVSPAKIVRDTEIRQTLGTPDLSRQVVLRDIDPERLLERTQALHGALDIAVRNGELTRYRSAAHLVAPRELQEQRRRRLPSESTLRETLRRANRDGPFQVQAFEPFINEVARLKTQPLLMPADYLGSPLEAMLEAHWYPAGREWVSLITLWPPLDAAALRQRLATAAPETTLIDLRRASEDLVRQYRGATLLTLAVALLAICALLLWRLPARRAIWCLVVVGAVVIAAAAVSYALSGPLNLYHLMGLLLVAGLGLDYALFWSRSGNLEHRRHIRHAVKACAASTVTAFGILGFSAIPALAALGTTVAAGTALALVAVGLSTREPAAPDS